MCPCAARWLRKALLPVTASVRLCSLFFFFFPSWRGGGFARLPALCRFSFFSCGSVGGRAGGLAGRRVCWLAGGRVARADGGPLSPCFSVAARRLCFPVFSLSPSLSLSLSLLLSPSLSLPLSLSLSLSPPLGCALWSLGFLWLSLALCPPRSGRAGFPVICYH